MQTQGGKGTCAWQRALPAAAPWQPWMTSAAGALAAGARRSSYLQVAAGRGMAAGIQAAKVIKAMEMKQARGRAAQALAEREQSMM